MKYIKKLLVLFLVINVFNSCTEEEVSYALEDISAPTNVKAIFNVSQDDTGTVTITPTAEGASTFEIYFGDMENETPTTASPGETVNHVYGEGEFSLRVVAIGITGLKSELVRIVTISFSAPTDLDFTAEISSTDPFEVSVTPTATNATVYDVYFGDVENEEPTIIMDTESAVHVYAEVGDYDVRVIARGAGAATIELTKTVTISGASNAVSLPITFDDATVNYAFGTFNGTSFEVVDNPDLSGANAVASKVGAITNSGAQFEGGAFNLGTPVDFAGDNKTISMKLWSEVSVAILLKFEGGVNGERQNEVVVTHGGTGWEDLSFDFATNATKSYIDGNQGVGEPFVPTGQYATLVMFIDGPGTTSGTFYWDEIKQEAAAAAAKPEIPIDMESVSLDYTWNGFGASDFGPIPAGVINNPDMSGINTSNKVLEIQKQSGAQVWAGASLDLAGTVDFSSGTIIKVKVWSPRIGTPVLFKMEDSTSPLDGNGNPTIVVEVIVNSTVAMAWEELTFDLTTFGAFSTANSYDRVILFPDFNSPGQGESFYFDDIILTDGSGGGSSSGKTSFPVDFETPGTGAAATWDVFEADTPPLEITANPDASGINTSATVAKFTAKFMGADYAGTVTALETPFTLDASNSTVKIMVWKSVISDVGIKFESNKASTGEIKVANTKINEWEEITFDMSGKIGEGSSTNIDAIVVFPDFDARTQDNVVYFDKITLNAAGGGGGGKAEISTLDFETAATMDGAFDAGATGATVSNPVSGGINTSANVYEFNKVTNSAWYSGTFKIYGQDIDFSSKTSFSIKVWSPKPNVNIRFQIEKEGGGGGATQFVDQTVVNANEWVTLTFDFGSLINSADAYDKLVIFLDFDDVAQAPGDGSIYYIDDITQQ
ncbi:hypothetical protein OO010_01780 [Flavobacteriaceae bacterium KMM 6898]|nr:hypothetical protein [Flavobacteriaceae bacterium KMM 6898]